VRQTKTRQTKEDQTRTQREENQGRRARHDAQGRRARHDATNCCCGGGEETHQQRRTPSSFFPSSIPGLVLTSILSQQNRPDQKTPTRLLSLTLAQGRTDSRQDGRETDEKRRKRREKRKVGGSKVKSSGEKNRKSLVGEKLEFRRP
jgi:hypothetical protein